VIKYVANIASGVHSNSALTPEDKTIDRIRRSTIYTFHDGKPRLTIDTGALVPEFRYDQQGLDPLLVELYDTARLLFDSPSIAELERIIKIELKAI
jgi:hypothetical protein